METANEKTNELYSFKYRIVKTVLLIFSWIASGLSMEVVGPTFEDLRVNFDLSYTDLALGLVLRASGFLVFTFLSGLIIDKLTKYTDSIMAISGLIRVIR